VTIVAKGASNLVAREAAQVRRTEFLATTANPVDMQIMGIEGRAAVLRETAKTLQMDTDKVVPDIDTLRQKLAIKETMAAQAGAGAPGAGSSPAEGGLQGGTPPGPGATQGNGQQLMDGAPVTDLQ
jgi:RNase P/RNase MRP subunit p29